MHSIAIKQARLRLAKAQEALAKVNEASSFSAIEAAWSDLIISASGIYSKLEQGVKLVPSSKAWFDKKKNERRTDPLLSYVLHARNVDEHGIQEITAVYPAGSGLITIREPYDPKKLEGLQITVGTDVFGRVALRSSDESLVSTRRITKTQIVLEGVRDRGIMYYPPNSHLGATLPEATPAEVGRLLVAYLESLIAEAEQVGI